MVRPTASKINKAIAINFARIVCVVTKRPADVIPRSGCCSVFAMLEQLLPSITRGDENSNYEGISTIELNKLMQVYIFYYKCLCKPQLNRILSGCWFEPSSRSQSWCNQSETGSSRCGAVRV
mmetsp:Transcript_55048/g.145339  ORF Transcript_55048/g.145339 Transcript_55048/m.145339 type:complete len:122 (+) Transcript_55048:95-460(+)